MIKNCLFCKKEFKTWASRIKRGGGKYCGSSCSAKSTRNAKGVKHTQEARLNMSRAHIGIQAYDKHPNWKGGRTIDKSGYVLIKMQNYPSANKDGYIREHRLIMEKYLGRYLTRQEEIHHVNFNKQDNVIENLMILSSREHALLHQQLLRMETGL